MTQRRTTGQTVARTEKQGTWIALAVAFLAISLPQWVEALSGGKNLAYLPAVAFTVVALCFVVQARRRRSER